MSKALLFHGGGPTAVLNSSLSGALELLQEAGVQTDGALCGIAHVLDGRIRTIDRLDNRALEKLSRSPGSALGSGRDHLEPEDYHTIAGTLARLGYEYVIAAGGNGTMDTTVRLAEACRKYGIKVTGIPKTMDNDLSGTDHSPGFISAALYMAASCREALYDLNGLPIHVVVIEAFGRNAGWIAASSCLAGTPEVEGPDLILLPEDDFDEDAFLSRVEEVWKAKGKALVVASEGLHHKDGSPIVDPVFQVGRSVYFGDVSSHLSQLITRKLSIKSRSEKPGILSRSSIAWQSGLDRQEAWQCGREGARAALEGKSGFMSVIERLCDEPYSSRVKLVEISPAILEERRLPDTYRKDFGASEAFRTWLSPLVREDELGQFTTFID